MMQWIEKQYSQGFHVHILENVQASERARKNIIQDGVPDTNNASSFECIPSVQLVQYKCIVRVHALERRPSEWALGKNHPKF